MSIRIRSLFLTEQYITHLRVKLENPHQNKTQVPIRLEKLLLTAIIDVVVPSVESQCGKFIAHGAAHRIGHHSHRRRGEAKSAVEEGSQEAGTDHKGHKKTQTEDTILVHLQTKTKGCHKITDGASNSRADRLTKLARIARQIVATNRECVQRAFAGRWIRIWSQVGQIQTQSLRLRWQLSGLGSQFTIFWNLDNHCRLELLPALHCIRNIA